MKSIPKIANAAAKKSLPRVLPMARAHSAQTVAANPVSLLANLKQAQALAKVMIYAELMLTAIEDLHVHVPLIRRQKLGNLMRNSSKELKSMIHTFYLSSKVGRMDEPTEKQFYREIDQVEEVHKLLHKIPPRLLPAIANDLQDIITIVNAQKP